MVTSPDNLQPPVTSLVYRKPWGKDAAESIYLFDQEAARAGIVYHAEYPPASGRWYSFSILVSGADRDRVQEIIDRLNPPRRRKRKTRFCGWWTPIKPTRLSKTYKGHSWRFAAYRESSFDRDDGLRYTAFLFRNQDRTVFGVREWLGNDVLVWNDVLAKMAHRIVIDREFRNSLVSGDPDLPQLWKRR
jgi:hypothetical protein